MNLVRLHYLQLLKPKAWNWRLELRVPENNGGVVYVSMLVDGVEDICSSSL